MAVKRVPPYGPLSAEIAFVGQSPGKQEGIEGRPFVGPAGKLLREICTEVGIDPEAAYYTNICDRVLLGSEEPTPEDITEGKERLQGEIAQLTNLKFVVLVGTFAARLVFSGLMREMSGMQGFLFGRLCVAIYHPSAVLRARNKEQAEWTRNEIKQTLPRVKQYMIEDEKHKVLTASLGQDHLRKYALGRGLPPQIVKPTRDSGVAVLLGGRPETEAPAERLSAAPTIESDDWLRILLDETLERQQPLWEKPVSYFRASEVSDPCLRSLCLSAMGHRMPVEARLRRIFNTGLAIEEVNVETMIGAGICPSEMRNMQATAIYKDPPIVGHVDVLVTRPSNRQKLLGEIKSINEGAFKRLSSEHGPTIAGESPLFKTHYRYIMQWNTYAGAPNLGLNEGFILFESKDKQAQKFYWLLRDDALLESTLTRLRLVAPYILSDPMRVPPTSLEPDDDPAHAKCPRRYLCTRIPAEGADYKTVRAIDAELRG